MHAIFLYFLQFADSPAAQMRLLNGIGCHGVAAQFSLFCWESRCHKEEAGFHSGNRPRFEELQLATAVHSWQDEPD